MSASWERHDRHWMTQGTTMNVTYHATPECRNIKHKHKVVDRSDSFLAYHEPEPCEACHEDVEPTRNKNAPDKYTKSIVGGDD